MDWPKFDFCVLLWVLCVSKASGDSTALISSKEPKCEWGDILPRKDECNTCICYEGDVHCTNLPCRAPQRSDDQPECREGQPVIKLDECNECFCFDGKLDCSDLICIRGSKCTEGQVIPRPDHCNICKCFEGHIVCTNYECNPRSKRRPLPGNATTDVDAVIDEELAKECEPDDFIPPPPPPFDCNKCVCINHQIFCSMDHCHDNVPNVNSRFNQKDEPNDNLEVHDKKIAVDPYLNLFYKNYDKTPTKLVHTHAYNGFHQEIKVHSKNLSQDTSKLIKALASSLDNPVLGQIGDKIESTSTSINNSEQTKLSGGQAVQNYIPNALHSNEIAMGQHPPNLSVSPLHSLSSLITSGAQSNETILVIPTKQKPFAANQQPHSLTPFSSESADMTLEQKNPYYSGSHPANLSPREYFKNYNSQNKNLINQSPLPLLIPINSETNDENIQLSGPYTLEHEPVSPSNAYKLIQVQHPDNLNRNSNTSAPHSMYNPSHDQLKFPSNVNDAQHAQPHSQSGLNSVYQPYQNEPSQNGLHQNHNNHYPSSNIQYNPTSPSQSQFDQNHTTPYGHQNIMSDQDGNYPRHPYKLNQINDNHSQRDPSQNEFDLDQGKPVFGSDNRVIQNSLLYTSVEQNPAINKDHQYYAPHNGLQSDQNQHQPVSTTPEQDKNPTQMRLHEKQVLSTLEKKYLYLPHSKFEPNPTIYKTNASSKPENGLVQYQESNKPHMTGYDLIQNSYKPEQDKDAIIFDDRRPNNHPYPQFEPNPKHYHNQQFTPPQNGHQSDQNKQQSHSPYEPNETQTNSNMYQAAYHHYSNPPENSHHIGQDDHAQHNNANLQKNNLPLSSMGPNEEERLSTLDNKGNRYNVTNTHYKTHSSLTYVSQYVPTHQDKTAGQSPGTSNLDDRFNLYYQPPKIVEQNGWTGKRPANNPANNGYMNASKPDFLPIQRENEVDPTIVKVYQYLNQPKIHYPLKQNENYPHIGQHSLVTKNHPAPHQENLQYHSRSSMSVEDDKSGLYNIEYPTSSHSKSPLWDSGYRDKDKKTISYPNSSPSQFYSGQYDNKKIPSNKSSYANNEPKEFQAHSRYKKPSFERGQYDENKVLNKNIPYDNIEDIPVGSAYYPPSFQTGQFDKNKGPILSPQKALPFERGQYDKNKGPVLSPQKTLSYETGQYDKNKGPVLSPQKALPFERGQYDKNKIPFKGTPYAPDASPVSSRHNPPLSDSVQHEESNVPNSYNQYGHNDSQPEASPIVPHKKKPLFNLLQLIKHKIPTGYKPNISDTPSIHNESSIWDFDSLNKNNMPFNYDPFDHNISQPEASPVVSHNKSPLFSTLQYDKSKVPVNYDPRVYNGSQIGVSPVSSRYTPYLASSPNNRTGVPEIKYGLTNHIPEFEHPLKPWKNNNFSVPEASPVSSHDTSPLFHTVPYDKNNFPNNYDPHTHNISQTEGSPSNSHYSPYLTLTPYNGTGSPKNKYGLTNQVPEFAHNPLGSWKNNNFSQPEASPVSSHDKSPSFQTIPSDKNNFPFNYDPHYRNLSQIEAFPSKSRYPPYLTPSSYNGTGLLDNKYGLTNQIPEFEHNPLGSWENKNFSRPEPTPVSSHEKSLLFHAVPHDKNNEPFNYDPYAHNISHPEAFPSNSRYPPYMTPSSYNGTGLLDNKYGLTNYVPEFGHNPLTPWKNNNFSQPEASPVSSHDTSPLFHTVPYDKNNIPNNYDPRTHNISHTEGSQSNSHYSPYLTLSPYNGTGLPNNKYGQTNQLPEFEHNPLGSWKNKNFSQPEASLVSSHDKTPSFQTIPYDKNNVPYNYDPHAHNISYPSNSRYPPYLSPYDGTGTPINKYGQTNHVPAGEQNPLQPWAQKNKNSLPIDEQVNNDDIILPETLSTSLYNPFPTSEHEKQRLPINEHQNNPYNGYNSNLNNNISTLNPLYLSNQQYQSVDHDPSYKQPETGNFNDYGPVKGIQYISNSAEDPNSSIKRPDKPGTSSQQQPNASFDDRGSLDAFQYKFTSDEDSDTPKANLNKNKPAKGLLDDTDSLSVIPQKHEYANYSPYPNQNNDPRSQYKFTQNTPVGVTNPGNEEESHKEFKLGIDQKIAQNQTLSAFDDRQTDVGFQYISNSEEDSQNKPDHDQFKPIPVGKPQSESDKNSLSSNLESTALPENENPVTIDVDSINPDILKILQNANKPLSIEDLINEFDSHKQPQHRPYNDLSTSTDLDDDNDQLQSRFNVLFPDSYPQQSNKKITEHPPIDESEFFLNELDHLALLRLLFPFKFQNAPGKHVDQLPNNEKDLLSMLLGTQNIYNLTKNRKPSPKEKLSAQLPELSVSSAITHESSNISKKQINTTLKGTPALEQSFNPVDPRNNGKVNDIQPLQHKPTIQHLGSTGQVQDPPKYEKQVMKISDESLNFPPIQYPDVHIILHHSIGESYSQTPYIETSVDEDDYLPSIMHSRIKRPKQMKEECGDGTKWLRNCHVCSCRGGQAKCNKIPGCELRQLEDPMMCKPYSTFKMGTCYFCECNGDGIPECDASECDEESIHKESSAVSAASKAPVYHEFFEDVKAKAMLSYYTFFKKLPKDLSDVKIDYPTCEVNTTWVSSCHNCECKDDHKHECTKIEGCKLDLKALGMPTKCKPNSKFYPKGTNMACQQCLCDDEGNPTCPLVDDKNQ